LSFVEDHDGSYGVGFDTDAPAKVVFGQTLVHNRSSTPIRLVSATLAEPRRDGAALVETRALDLRAHPGDIIGADRWPSAVVQGRTSPVSEDVVQPGADAELLFIVRVERTGNYAWIHPQVSYLYNGRLATATSVATFFIQPK
jgi:hypothetical protein